MKLKRAKQYRKQMHQYEIHFGFREPYQVLLDSAILETAWRMKIDIISRLKGILQGEVKPMITQCDMRHLYNATPKNEELITQAKTYERRRCNHHELDEPLSTLECLTSVVGATNKHRYIVASEDRGVRKHMRAIPGVPLIYISSSIVLLEPMTTATEDVRDREEKQKFKAGLKGKRNAGAGEKRKRDDEEGGDGQSIADQSTGDAQSKKKKKSFGPKAPNPLSVKKAKKATAEKSTKPKSAESAPKSQPSDAADGDDSGKRKRRRKHKPKADGDGEGEGGGSEAGDVAGS